MELPTQEGDMPLPLNTSYGGAHIIHHDPISPLSTQIPSNGPAIHHNHNHHHEHVTNFKKIVKYRECLKNHAATMGGNATDGCGEFMPSGEEGSIEALTCSACNCHRNFHRKEVEGETQQIANTTNYDGFYHHHHHHNVNSRMVGRKVFVGHHHKGGYLGGGGGPEGVVGYHHAAAARGAVPPHQMIMSYNHVGSLPSDQSEEEGGVGGVRVVPSHLVKKRFRTKFTQEQKEKMLEFAERVGWKMQKQEEGVVQQFCQEVGVKRRVLKVWMHNNKHSLGKKNSSSSNNNHHDDQGVNVVVGGGENQD